MLNIFLRFKQVEAELKIRDENKSQYSALYRLNVISLVVGLGVSFGLFLVGNFQIPRNKTKPHQDETPTSEDRFIQYIHWIGALFAFFGGLAWMCMHTFISIVLCKDPNKGIWRKKLAVIRFAITLALFCILMAGVAIGVLFRVEKEDENATKKLYFSAALCEWLATMLILLYVLTLLPQLDGIEISLPKVTSGHIHKGFFSSSDNKVGVQVEQEMTNGGI